MRKRGFDIARAASAIAGSRITVNVLLVVCIIIGSIRSTECHHSTTTWILAAVLPMLLFGAVYVYILRSIGSDES